VKPIAFLAALVALAVAQHWEFEQVDSSANDARDLHVRRMPDSTLSLSYHLNSGQIVYAFKDSVWHRESVATAWYSSAFDVGPNGEVGVAYGVVLDTTVYVHRTDSGWVSESISMTGYFGTQLSYDRTGHPFILQNNTSVVHGAMRTDTGWTVELVMPQTPGIIGYGYCTYGPAQFDRENHPWVCCGEDVDFNMYNWWGYVHVRTKGEDTWAEHTTLGGLHYEARGYSLALDTSDAPRLCYYLTSAFVCDGDNLGGCPAQAVMRLDQFGQPHAVYDTNYAYRTPAGWHTYSFQPRSAVDFVFDPSGQPVVALAGDDGIWLAHGVDIVGKSEEQGQPTAYCSRLTTSVVRNVLPTAGSPKPQAASHKLAAGCCGAQGARPASRSERRERLALRYLLRAGSTSASRPQGRNCEVRRPNDTPRSDGGDMHSDCGCICAG
jgi:hypothetical protein